MSSFPCVVRTVTGSGEVRYSLGHRLVDRYLEFVAGRCRPNTLRAVAFDLKAFFTVVVKDPAEVTPRMCSTSWPISAGTAAWCG
jgi:integrase/recombinase XerD